MSLDLFAVRPEQFGDKIPYIVTDIIYELVARRADKVQGIFRMAGSDTETKRLIAELGRGQVKDWSVYNVHSLSTALKRYFRQMGESQPLVPFELYACVIALIRSLSSLEEDILIAKIKPLFENYMPPSKYKTLVYLCRFLKWLTKNEAESMMNSQNLSICIGPNILVSPEEGSMDTFTESISANTALEMMIRRVDDFFGDVKITDKDLCTNATMAAVGAPGVKVVTHLAKLS